MKRLILILLVLLLPAVCGAGCTAPQTALLSPSVPEAPAVPQEVLSVWHSPPSPQGLPPDISKTVVLEPYGQAGCRFVGYDTDKFFLRKGQWIDIIVESSMPIYFDRAVPGNVCFEIVYRTGEYGTGHIDWEGIRTELGGFEPFSGKWLYENRTTETDTGTIWSTAVRVCPFAGAGDYFLTFDNYDPHRQVEIKYDIYELSATPDWGLEGSYYYTELKPWAEAVEATTLSDEDKKRIYEDWLKQFK